MNLLSDPRIWEEIQDDLLPAFGLSNFFSPEEGERARLSLENALSQPMETLAREAFKANVLAKEVDQGWYEIKDVLLRTFVSRAKKAAVPENEGVVAWGLGQDDLGQDVLYIDLIGYGQISFHVFWENMEGIQDYPYKWTEILNEEALEFGGSMQVDRAAHSGGHLHNLLVRAGVAP